MWQLSLHGSQILTISERCKEVGHVVPRVNSQVLDVVIKLNTYGSLYFDRIPRGEQVMVTNSVMWDRSQAVDKHRGVGSNSKHDTLLYNQVLGQNT